MILNSNLKVVFIILSFALICAGCAINKTPTGSADKDLGSFSSTNHAVTEVFYATDRKINSTATELSQRFGSERGHGSLTYGKVKVSIPRDHRMGRLESPSILRFEFRSNPDKHVVLLNISTVEKNIFFSSIAKSVASSSKKNVFIFVHGYRVTFEDAARRTAQMSYDLRFDGAPIFYSWPSAGTLSGYVSDAEATAWTQKNLEIFLKEVALKSNAESIYLIGHSMGTRSLTQAFVSLQNKEPMLMKRFKEIILAAPDIDADIFTRDIAPAMAQSRVPITLYASSNDVALKASQVVNNIGRTGKDVIITKGIETIDASTVQTDFLDHSYFAEDKSILSDIYYILHQSLRANSRSGLQQISGNSGVYWRFKE